MKITIDTEREAIIVVDSFFKQIDKINDAIKMGGGTEITYTDYVKQQFEKAIQNPLLRKADL